MSPRTIAVVVAAGLSTPSSTRLLADRLGQATARALAVAGEDSRIETIELRELAHDAVDRLLTGYPTPRLAGAVEAVTGADALIAVTPVFTTGASGIFKTFVDGIDPEALRGMPTLLAATGGTERHSLAIDYALRPVFAYLGASIASTGVYAASQDWGSAEASAALGRRIDRAGGELAELVLRAPARVATDPFALPAGFDPSGVAA
ncbi:CE1759 family FMN reductase [Homoserinibacter sp. YIM 151385]|uniref:CE1759 family FMN reductase n=1 Tax=Homoserinibacter sp. YIM 151385 TaxID=2985506 RepID=UPI0022F00DD9|nr:CE1759 family FMN reductase [Homoserinibacter sp. YIM 151385]WBU38919.1 NAD(P)H-dependent oxidoreductase [Homoserinibacter sp. YIM 151385]